MFLDDPYPTNLPVVDACLACNNGFSADEEYVACLIEAALAGTTEPDKIRRPSVAAILRRAPGLRARIDSARAETDGNVSYKAELGRVRNVVLKLARGHAGYELSEPCRQEPTHVSIVPIGLFTKEQREEFEDANFPEIWPEVGSRAMQRMSVLQPRLSGPQGDGAFPGFIIQDWQDVQDERYAYLATADGTEVRVRSIIGGYLACDVRWAQ